MDVMTPEQWWPAIMENQTHGVFIRNALSLIATVPVEAMQQAIERIERETTIGPFTDPTAYIDGSRFKNAREYQEILRSLIELRKVLKV